ncbi:MAG: hypothetical protein PHV82_02990 [Victivallaceae bacterium]|nr:hypothetical protein [Victivallaceae bacterium]
MLNQQFSVATNTVLDKTNLNSIIEKLGFEAEEIEGVNPKLRKTTIPFIFPNAENSLFKRLRKHFDFCKIIKNEDEFHAQLTLAKWVNSHIYRSDEVAAVSNPLEVLELSREKATGFWCGHFGHVYAACANAAGFTARHLGIDSLHTKYEDSTHHGTNEIYSTVFRKWFIIDSMHGCIYFKDKVPLNAYEIATEWLKNQGANIEIYDFNADKIITRSHKCTVNNQHESSAYYFFFTDILMDPFYNNGEAYPHRLLFFEDRGREKHIWYQGPGGKTKGRGSYRHGGYAGSFLHTDQLDDFYFDVNTVYIKSRSLHLKEKSLALSFETFTPNFSYFLYKLNDGPWRKFSGHKRWNREEGGYLLKDGKYNIYPDKEPHLNEIKWKLKPGHNSIEVKPVNYSKREGATSSLYLTLKTNPAFKKNKAQTH